MFISNATGWPRNGHQPMLTYRPPAGPTAYQPVPAQPFQHMQLQTAPMASAQTAHFAPPASYPASNQPAMWNRLQPYIAHSPTLSHQLTQLAHSGWSIQWNPHQPALCDSTIRRINIDPAAPDADVMQFLAHEVRHAFETPVDTRLYASDVDYASVKMRNEAVAVVNHLQVRSEIFQSAGYDIGFSQPSAAYYENALSFSRAHGNQERLLQHIQRLMTWELTGMHLRPYWEVYLNGWRNHRGLPPVSVPPGMAEGQQMQAWQSLAAEMNGR